MSTPDVRDVLEKFVATLSSPGDAIVRDARELPYPKDIIKSALQQCIKVIEETDQRRFLRDAYRSLGTYQELSDEERKALSALHEVGPPGPAGSELQEEQARRIRDVAVSLQAVMTRLKEETAILTQELNWLPGPD